MENLKKLASKILEKQGISHEKLMPRKGEIKYLREYLSSVGYRLETTYYTIYNPRFVKGGNIKLHQEVLERRSYKIIKF